MYLRTLTCAAMVSFQPDMQRAVEVRLRDTSTLVREATVDLLGRFVLSRPELTSQYYEMIAERIRVCRKMHFCTTNPAYMMWRPIFLGFWSECEETSDQDFEGHLCHAT